MEEVSVNPIIPGFAPDPSVVYVDGVYYLVNSSFHMFPGLPVYASKDLANWKHIGNAFNRKNQLSLSESFTKLHRISDEEKMAAQGGLYGPSIRYHKGTFYIVCTNVLHKTELPHYDNEFQNFILSTNNIWSGEWSDPVFYDFFGIDTSLFWDDDDRPKVAATLITIPPWRGPKNIWGPYEVNPANPVMAKSDPKGYIQYTGHGDLLQDETGQWYFICLGVRKTQQGHVVMGRESVITTAQWPEGGYPTINPAKSEVLLSRSRPDNPSWSIKCPSSSFTPQVDLLHIRDPASEHYRYSLYDITLRASKAPLDQADEPVTFVGKRQRKLDGSATATLIADFSELDGSSQLQTGLCYYKDEHRFARIMICSRTKSIVFEIINKARSIEGRESQQIPAALAGKSGEVDLGITYTERSLSFWYTTRENGSASEEQEMVQIDSLQLTSHCFVGPVIGIFATGNDTSEVVFKDFYVD